MAYRKELDGLRALSVIAVFLYHLDKSLMQSGFLGVDIFFVLSGYVISLSIVNKKYKNLYNFLSDFYIRRFKRLAPSLFLYIIAASLFIALIIHSAGSYYLTGISSMLGLSNYYLLKLNGDYWGLDAALNPFTQTWSLSLEAQFYFLFPVFVGLLFFNKHTNTIKFRIRPFILITLISLTLYFLLFPNYNQFTYYSLPTRIWQLTLGVIIYIVDSKNILNFSSFANKLSILFLSFVILLFFVPIRFSIFTHFLITIFSALLILSLTNDSCLKRFLSFDCLTYIGRLSYQIYLWHWGVLVLLRWTIGQNNITNLFIVPLVFLISSGVHHYVENSFREIEVKFPAISISLLFLFTSFIPLSLAGPFRNKIFLGKLINSNTPQNLLRDKEYIVFGDSHANDIWKLLNNSSSFKLFRFTKPGCRYYDLSFNKSECKDQFNINNQLFASVSKADNKVIIISSRLKFDDIKKSQSQQFLILSFLNKLLYLSKSDIIFKFPHADTNSPNMAKPIRCIKRFYRPKLDINCFVKGTSKKEHIYNSQSLRAELELLAKNNSKFHIWDLTNILCPTDYCFTVTEDNQYLHDNSHLFYTSPTLADKIVRSLNEVTFNISSTN